MPKSMELNDLVVGDMLGKELTAIKIKYWDYEQEDHNQIKEIESLSFYFGDKVILISALIDTDEIKIELLKNKDMLSMESKPLFFRQYIGKKLGFIWQCTHLDHKDYLDMCVLAFENLHPSISILCESSALLLFESKPINILSK